MTVKILYQAELRQLVGIDERAYEAIADGFTLLQQGKVTMPPIMHIEATDRKGDIDVKSAYVRGMPYIAIKIASGFYQNPARGLPSGSGMMVLLSAETGFCQAVLLDDGYLTDLRTGLAGAVAAEHVAPVDIDTVGVIGTGTQARWQVECLALKRRFSRVLVWGRSAEKARACAGALRESVGLDVQVADRPDHVVRESQVVITVTASDQPLISADALHEGLHITAVGADFPGKRELDPQVLTRADKVVCDSLAQCRVNGELQHLVEDGELPPALDVIELGELTSGSHPGRTSGAEITVCDLTGTGVQDTAIANLAYRLADA